MTVESVNVPVSNGNVDAVVTWWSQNPNKDSPYAFVLRIYTIKEGSSKEHAGKSHIMDNLMSP